MTEPWEWEPTPDPTAPPSGWYRFGTHAGWGSGEVPILEFSEQTAEDGLPLWERPFAHRYLTDDEAALNAANRVKAWVEFDRRNRPDRPEDENLAIAYEQFPVTRADLAALMNANIR